MPVIFEELKEYLFISIACFLIVPNNVHTHVYSIVNYRLPRASEGTLNCRPVSPPNQSPNSATSESY